MKLRDLRHLLGCLEDARDEVADDDAFFFGGRFPALDEEERAKFIGKMRGRRFLFRELEELDIDLEPDTIWKDHGGVLIELMARRVLDGVPSDATEDADEE